MLYRKIADIIEKNLKSYDSILMVEGARQIGKSYIIRHVCQNMYPNYLEINLEKDFLGEKRFAHVDSLQRFYMQIEEIASEQNISLEGPDNTIIFLDEIQRYPNILSMLKPLKFENKYRYITSGSALGIALKTAPSIPGGSVRSLKMYPLDFEEFLIANGTSKNTISLIRESYNKKESLDEFMHNKLLSNFKNYLLIGGLPKAVVTYKETKSISALRKVHEEIYQLYSLDASRYDEKNRLKIQRVYSLIPSNMENKKKRVKYKDLAGVKGDRSEKYQDEFDYLISSGISLAVDAISNPKFPLTESVIKNLIKLYINDVGLLSYLLYSNNSSAILDNVKSINLGSIYETVIAQELMAHGNSLFYYDNRKHGEVDFIINNFDELKILPIEVKSGKDYSIHSALNNLTNNDEYPINNGIVLSNERVVKTKGKITYLPIYYIMFLGVESEKPSLVENDTIRDTYTFEEFKNNFDEIMHDSLTFPITIISDKGEVISLKKE